MRPLKRRKEGQTVIEFIFVSVLFIFMLVLTFNAILAFCIHQYISYATFMAARAYQASNSNSAAQYQAAQATFADYIPGLQASGVSSQMNFSVFFPKFSQLKSLALITGVQVTSPQTQVYNLRGTSAFTVTFNVPFAQLPLGSLGASFSQLSLTASSSLGREVTQQECLNYFQTRYGKIMSAISGAGAPSVTSAASLWIHMDDNGC